MNQIYETKIKPFIEFVNEAINEIDNDVCTYYFLEVIRF